MVNNLDQTAVTVSNVCDDNNLFLEHVTELNSGQRCVVIKSPIVFDSLWVYIGNHLLKEVVLCVVASVLLQPVVENS